MQPQFGNRPQPHHVRVTNDAALRGKTDDDFCGRAVTSAEHSVSRPKVNPAALRQSKQSLNFLFLYSSRREPLPMSSPAPIVLVPGLNCSARLYAGKFRRSGGMARSRSPTTPATTAWRRSPLAFWPTRRRSFALAMGGYIALAVVRLAPERVTRLALLDTSARAERRAAPAPDRPRAERTLRRDSAAAVSLVRPPRPPGR